MSSNANHIIPVLSRDNYEEYFLLYVDEELTPDAKKAVDDFVLLHPDLKEELDLLCSTKLSTDVLSYENKEELFADRMQLNTVDESLLLYIDNELPAWEAEIVEAQLKKNEAFAQQHQLLLKTKLTPEPITYPYKSALYRRAERRIMHYWLRAAAAVILVAGGTAVWMNNDHSKTTDAIVAATPKNTIQQPAPGITSVETPGVKKEDKGRAANVETTISKNENTIALQPPVKTNRASKKESKSTLGTHIAGEHLAALNNLPVVKKKKVVDLQTGMATKTPQPVLNNSIVTSAFSTAYMKKEAPDRAMDPVAAVARTTNERSGGVKTFLRKATRFIERRTGIKTVNDDDELLVGVVALKL